MAWKATQVKIDTDINNLMPRKNARINQIQEELGIQKEAINFTFISISGDNLYNFEILQAFQDAIDKVSDIPEVTMSLTPFNFISFEARGRQIAPTTLSPTTRAPINHEELELFIKRVQDNALSENFVIADQGRILTAAFINQEETDSATFTKKVKAAVEPLQKLVTVHYTGESLFQDHVAYYLIKDFSILLVLALTAMLLIFWLSFRSIRAMILPITVVSIGTIWTLGVMAIMGFKITVVTVIIPSLVLTIGSSYTIHILNEYYRNRKKPNEDKAQWLADAVEHVIRTVILASLTTIISFMSLLTTTLSALREFGLAISCGIFFCAILGLFFLPSIFYLIKLPRKYNKTKNRRRRLTRIVATIGQWAYNHHLAVFLFFILIFLSFLAVYPNIMHKSDYFSYFPPKDPIVKGSRFINEFSGGTQTFNITLRAADEKKNAFLNSEILRTIDQFETVISSHPSVTNILSFNKILKIMNKTISGKDTIPESRALILLLYRYFSLIPKEKVTFGQDSTIIDGDANQITIYLKLAEPETYSLISEDDTRKFYDFVLKEVATIFDDSIDVLYWGNTLLFVDSSNTIKRDQLRSTLISMILGMLVSWLFFKSLTFSVFAIIPLLSGIFFYFINLFIFSIPLDITTILVTNVTVGVGLDDAIHFIFQYRRQRLIKQNGKQSLLPSLVITGRAIVLTTLSLVAGLLVLCFASFKPVKFFGFLVAGTLFSTMIGTIVFIPAAIRFYEDFMIKRKKTSVREKKYISHERKD